MRARGGRGAGGRNRSERVIERRGYFDFEVDARFWNGLVCLIRK